MLAAVGTTMTAWQPPDAEAVVVCQRGQKKFRLRASACKPKETPVFDTTALDVERGRVDEHDGQLADQGGRLTEQAGRVEHLEIVLGQTCGGAPERKPISANLFGGGTAFGCRAFDGDPSGCEQRYQSGEGGAAGCAYLNDNCIPCHAFFDALGVCDNACQSIAPCADATRSASVGDCDDVTTQPACEQSWGVSSGYATSDAIFKPTTCWWDGADCNECHPDDLSNGDCTNTCLTPAQLPVCRAEGRSFGNCSALDGNEAGCLSTYEMSGVGTLTCWYDAGECMGCDPEREHAGSCENLC